MARKEQKAPSKEKDPYQKSEKKLLTPDSGFMYFLTKAGQVIILNLIWLLSCIPLVTIGTATTSLYYAMMKNIRRSRGYPAAEYWNSFKRTLLKGCIFTVVFAAWLFLLYRLRLIVLVQETEYSMFLGRMYAALMAVTAAVLVYLFPVLSRFTMSMWAMVKLSFVMAVRYLGYTILILAGTAFLAFLQFYFLPMPTVFFLPGAWCYVCTFMIEKALRKYMPAPGKDADAWYYE
ncbi:MAG: DUF624 domain-containing protein [Lachnospiraceae bacterium]|nr:DUF624 domain-containing protein [Lachnospiraceae bacterium]